MDLDVIICESMINYINTKFTDPKTKNNIIKGLRSEIQGKATALNDVPDLPSLIENHLK